VPEALVERASELLSPDEKELQAVLRTLSEQKARVEAQLRDAEDARARMETESEKLERKLGEVEREAARLRKEGKRAFLEELKEARRQVAEAIEQTKGPSKDARALNKASHDLQDIEERTQRDVETKPPATEQTRPVEVKVGDVVELAILPGSRVSVVAIEGDEIVVAGGAMKMRVTLEQLRKSAQPNKRR
jgi:DNA mismatch repair protein MutS2